MDREPHEKYSLWRDEQKEEHGSYGSGYWEEYKGVTTTAMPHERWISYEEYLELDRTSIDVKYEYVDGRIYAMSGGSTSHSLIAMNISTLLRMHLRGKTCRAYNSDMKFCLSETVRYYPDVTASCDPRDTQTVKHDLYYPRLVIEVLPPSTELRDRTEKLAQYQRHPTVEEYVLSNSTDARNSNQ